MRFRTKGLFAATLFAMVSLPAHADWMLDSGASSFYYVTSKASAISEVNSFTALSGMISDKGEAGLRIDLASVDTAIEIRNQRMRDIVFKVAEYPAATVSLMVDTAALDAMKAGAVMQAMHTATVSLHGMQQELAADLQVIKVDADTIRVQTAKPLLVSAGSFGLAEGVEELRTIAGLPSINPTVVVNFSLVYDKQ